MLPLPLTAKQQKDLKECVIADIREKVEEPDLKRFGVSFYDAGLIYDVTVDANANITVVHTLTSDGCKFAQAIETSIAAVCAETLFDFMVGKKYIPEPDLYDEVTMLKPGTYSLGLPQRRLAVGIDATTHIITPPQSIATDDKMQVLVNLTYEPFYDRNVRMPDFIRATLGL